MAIPVARVHLAMAHAALPGLLPTPPKCTMLPLLPTARPCAADILPSSPPKPSRADAAGRWDAHKINKQTCSPASTSSSDALDGKKSLTTRTSSASSSKSRADSEERWDAHKKPAASPASSSSSTTSSNNKTKACWISKRRPNNGHRGSSSSAAERWDAHKKPPADELDDGGSSTGSNDVEMDMPQKTPPRSLYYSGASFITSPEPSLLPMPSFLIRVA